MLHCVNHGAVGKLDQKVQHGSLTSPYVLPDAIHQPVLASFYYIRNSKEYGRHTVGKSAKDYRKTASRI